MTLWSSSEIASVTGGKSLQDFNANGISIDSREVETGDLFVALKAARDGHEFVKGAIESGAAGALVSYVPEGCENLPLVLVDDVEGALAKMGEARRARVRAKIIAVTGSAGKTSTKEMLRTVLEGFGKTHASVKSFNNHWGVPLTLARMPVDTQFGVFEIGMNAPGEISPLVKMVKPDLAAITNIAAVHLAGFENELGIAREKASILDGLDASGKGIVYGDMEHLDFVRSYAKHPIISFGRAGHNDVRLEESDAVIGGLRIPFELEVPGGHHRQNALIVFAACHEWGLDLERAANVLQTWQAPSGRGEMFVLDKITIVDESYNANPLSMRAAISTFAQRKAKRKIAVLGTMKELGPQSDRFHAELADFDALKSLKVVHVVGEDARPLYDALGENKGEFFHTVEGLIEKSSHLFGDDDAILVKGSNGIGLGRFVDAMKKMGQRTS